MLPTVSVVRIASGATVLNTSRVGARESGPGFAWHVAHAFSNTAAPSGADCAAAVDAIRSINESNEKASRMGADLTVVSGSNWPPLSGDRPGTGRGQVGDRPGSVPDLSRACPRPGA